MWIATTIGFFSVVAHTDDEDTLLVRARAREDLDALRLRYLPDLEIVENGGADYRFRAYMRRDEWEHAAAQLAADIDYPNFKNAVAERQGPERAHLYSRVWETLRNLQR